MFDRDYYTVGNETGLAFNIGDTLAGTNTIGGVWDFKNLYGYDGMNRLSTLSQTSQNGGNAVSPKLVTQSYNAASEVADVRRYSTIAASTGSLEVHSRFGYDGAGRTTSITHHDDFVGSDPVCCLHEDHELLSRRRLPSTPMATMVV